MPFHANATTGFVLSEVSTAANDVSRCMSPGRDRLLLTVLYVLGFFLGGTSVQEHGLCAAGFTHCLRPGPGCVCVAMQRLTAPLVAGLLATVLSLLSRQCWADGGGPSLTERVIWAVNAGGDAHIDVHGIQFKKDPLEGKVGKGELTFFVVFFFFGGCSCYGGWCFSTLRTCGLC